MNERGRIENDTMVNAIVAYLFDKSQPAEVPAGRGQRRRGARREAPRRARLLWLPPRRSERASAT